MKIPINIALWALLLLLCGCSRPKEEAAPDLYSELRSVDKLVLAQMTVSKMATIQDLRLDEARGARQISEALLDAIKLGNRKAAYSYNTYLRAYIDLSQLRPEDVVTDDAAHTISITLPPVQTEFAGRDPGIREDHYRVTGLRSDIKSSERAELKEQMNAALKAEVEEKDVFTDRITATATAKAIAYFSSVAARDGYNVSVTVRRSKGGQL